jgi:hypothetical protein
MMRRLSMLTPLVALACAAPALAGDRDHEVDEWFHFLGSLNEYSALEPAGSRGSMGVGLGLGAHGEATERTALYDAQMRGKADETQAGAAAESRGDVTYLLPQVWLVKGSPWPVDFGATLGADPSAGFTQAGGHVQWTPFEGLGMPALSLRASYARLYGIEATELESYGVDAVAGIGFLRYFTVYGALGATRHSGRLVIDEGTKIDYLLTPGDETHTETKTWIEPKRAVGLKIMAWPPFVAVTGETAWRDGGERSVTAKLSVGM